MLTVEVFSVEGDEAVGAREAEPASAGQGAAECLVRHDGGSSGLGAQVEHAAREGVLRSQALGDAGLVGVEVELMAAAVGSRVHPPLHLEGLSLHE